MTQLTDVAPKRPEPRLTDSQKFIKDEEQKLIEYLREQAEQKKRRGEREEAEAAGVRAAGSPDRRRT